MKNLLEALNYTGCFNELRYIYKEENYYLSGVDFITQNDDIYTVTSISIDGEATTKRVTRELFPRPIVNAVAMHLDSNGPGHITKTILIIKEKDQEFKVFTGRRRGRFNVFVQDRRERKQLRNKLAKLKEVQ